MQCAECVRQVPSARSQCSVWSLSQLLLFITRRHRQNDVYVCACRKCVSEPTEKCSIINEELFHKFLFAITFERVVIRELRIENERTCIASTKIIQENEIASENILNGVTVADRHSVLHNNDNCLCMFHSLMCHRAHTYTHFSATIEE